MSETRALLSKLTALRRQLAPSGTDDGLVSLRERLVAGAQQQAHLEDALRRLSDALPTPPAALPASLTARARRLVEYGGELLAVLRSLLSVIEALPEEGGLPTRLRELVSMAAVALRLVQSFPDSPEAQLQLCPGVEAILAGAAGRAALLGERHEEARREAECVGALANFLTAAYLGAATDLDWLTHLAEELEAEAADDRPLTFPSEASPDPARFAAAHGLTTARVAARLVRPSAEFRLRSREVLVAALVHDVGLVELPGEVFSTPTPGPLTDQQQREVERHALVGADVARRLLPRAGWLEEAVAWHHERLDGTGYPDGLRGERLPPLARLLAVCDMYAALCSARPHRPALDTRTALTEVLLQAEAGRLDRAYAEWLLRLSFYPAGSVVELSDGALAVVVANHPVVAAPGLPAAPVVAVLTTGEGAPLPAPRHVDLARCEGRHVARGLSAAEGGSVLRTWFPGWAA